MHDLALALRQQRKTSLRHHGLGSADCLFGTGQRQHSLAGGHLPQGLDQYFGLLILENDAVGAGRGQRGQIAVFYR